jgi:hypothetical protein
MTTVAVVIAALAIALGALSAVALAAAVVTRSRAVAAGREAVDAAVLHALGRLGWGPETSAVLMESQPEALHMLRERVGPERLDAIGTDLRRQIGEVPLVPATFDGGRSLLGAQRARMLLSMLEVTRQHAPRPMRPL